MKTYRWILVFSFIVMLTFLVTFGQFGLSGANAKSSVPVVGMGDFRKIENQLELPATGRPVRLSRVGMGDFRMIESRQNVYVGFGDLRKLELSQIHTSTVGMGDFRMIESRQNVYVGFGDLRRLELSQIHTSTVGMGDLQRFEVGQ